MGGMLKTKNKVFIWFHKPKEKDCKECEMSDCIYNRKMLPRDICKQCNDHYSEYYSIKNLPW